MELPTQRVEEFLHSRIPVSKAINCQVLEASDKSLTLSSPKFLNTVIDEGFSELTAFALCKLASWAFLQVSLQRLDYKPYTPIVQATFSKTREFDSNSQSLTATCSVPSDKEWQQFLRMLSRKARSKVALTATLSDELGEVCSLVSEFDARDLDPV